LRFLIRLLPPRAERVPFLALVRSIASSVLLEVRNPKWTSYGALEVDVFPKSREDFALFLAALEPVASLEFSRDLNEAPPHKSKAELVAEAREYFNSERYWEAHETLESVWRNASGEEKRYLQGLILVCAAFVHHQKGEKQVALGILRRAAKQLSHEGDSYHGIAVKSLKSRVDETLGTGQLRVFKV
jgi:hypothetical protein